MTRPPVLDEHVVRVWLTEHADWRLDDGHLVRDVETNDYPSSIQILQSQVELAEKLNHHPVVTLGYRRLRFDVWTHDQRGITELDLRYAEGLDEITRTQFGDAVRR